MIPGKREARLAGLLYFLFVLAGPFCLIYVPGKIMVSGDAPATAANLLAHETLLRISVAVFLSGLAVWVVLGVVLQHMFSSVSKPLATMLLVFVAIAAGLGFANEVNYLAAIAVLRGDEFSMLGLPQRQAAAMLFMRLHSLGIVVSEMFWGLWLLPFGLLVIRSRFIPKLLGFWLLLDGAAYIAICLIDLISPGYGNLAFKVAQPALLAELAIMLWLITVGVRPQSASNAGS